MKTFKQYILEKEEKSLVTRAKEKVAKDNEATKRRQDLELQRAREAEFKEKERQINLKNAKSNSDN